MLTFLRVLLGTVPVDLVLFLAVAAARESMRPESGEVVCLCGFRVRGRMAGRRMEEHWLRFHGAGSSAGWQAGV